MPAMLPMETFVKLRTSWPVTKPPVMLTVAEANEVLSASFTVMAVLMAVAALFSV